MLSTTFRFADCAGTILSIALVCCAAGCGGQTTGLGSNADGGTSASSGSGTSGGTTTGGGSGSTPTTAGSTSTNGGSGPVTNHGVTTTPGSGSPATNPGTVVVSTNGGDDAGPLPTSGSTDASEDSGFGLNQICAGVPGLTGQAVLDALKPTYSATLTHPTGASTPLTITPHYAGGKVTCQMSFGGNGGGGGGQVYVEEQIDFVTGDGVFRESFPAGLYLAGPGKVSLQGVVLARDLKGSYKPTLTGYAWVQVDFYASLDKAMGAASGLVLEFGANSKGDLIAQQDPTHAVTFK